MHRIGFVVAPGFQLMSFAGISVFELANFTAGGPHYDVRVLSEFGGPVRSSLGATIDTHSFGQSTYDTIIAGGGLGPITVTEGTRAFIRQSMQTARRVASSCTGAFVLAEAGVLDGRRVTTHWACARELKARFPRVKMNEDCIFIVDGPIWTSAGMTAGIDLALGMVEQDLGLEIARLIAKQLVVYHRRAGGQSQHSALLELDAKSDRIQSALSFAKEHLKERLSVEQLAQAAHLSPRQFSRAFRAETGQSPAKAVENLRVEAARLMMEQGRLPVDVVADEAGFADRERMRRAFLRAFGRPPQVLRRNAQIQRVGSTSDSPPVPSDRTYAAPSLVPARRDDVPQVTAI
jgi:transcriptional regulator GlxA family with amidase domain